MTDAPNGISASLANLKHCFPNGIPMMVMHRTSPTIAVVTASSIPPKMSHRILTSRENAPPPYTTRFPNGASISPAILKHWRPTGIPTIVTHHKRPVSAQPRKSQNPHRMIHNIFPIKRISPSETIKNKAIHASHRIVSYELYYSRIYNIIKRDKKKLRKSAQRSRALFLVWFYEACSNWLL